MKTEAISIDDDDDEEETVEENKRLRAETERSLLKYKSQDFY